jgi:hypothetical protein
VVFVERFPGRVRGRIGDRTLVDRDAGLFVHETDELPHYAFPVADVHVDGEPEPHAAGHVTVAWEAMEEWYEEDERVEVHPRDPYHRIDTFGLNLVRQLTTPEVEELAPYVTQLRYRVLRR